MYYMVVMAFLMLGFLVFWGILGEPVEEDDDGED